MKVSKLNCRQLHLAAAATLFITCVTAAPQVESEHFVVQTRIDEEVLKGPAENTLEECPTLDETYISGTCMLSTECTNIGGIHSGTCAEGLGTCCIVIKTCDSTAIYNNTYFVNPEASSINAGVCTLTIDRADSDICQLRLDFTTFHLSQPDVNGNCDSDFLAVAGSVSNIPTICGDNQGSHMYVDVDPYGGALELTVDVSSMAISHEWIINVAQIACDSRYRAPTGCLQYYTETAGTVKSFNFADQLFDYGKTFSNSVFDTRQIANHNYGVCIEQAIGYCGVIWERDAQVGQYSFTVSGNVAAVAPPLIGDPATSSTGAINCSSDYVVIPEGVSDLLVQADRYCGLGFPLSVTSTATPFVFHVMNDRSETADGGNRGFQLRYRQTTSC